MVMPNGLPAPSRRAAVDSFSTFFAEVPAAAAAIWVGEGAMAGGWGEAEREGDGCGGEDRRLLARLF